MADDKSPRRSQALKTTSPQPSSWGLFAVRCAYLAERAGYCRDMARPCSYTQEIADRICARLAQGESLRTICRDADMPERHTVADWAIKDVHGFSAQYTQARDLGLDEMADEVMDIADDGTNDWMEREGHAVVNGEALGRSRLRFDARRWYLSKLAPKRYGDKQEVQLSGKLDINTMSAEEIEAELAVLAASGVLAPVDDGSDLV